MRDLVKNKDFQKEVFNDLTLIAKTNKLLGFEFIKAIHLHPDVFENSDLLTPTMKMKRQHAQEMFKGVIQDLYTVLNAAPRKSKL